MEKFKNLMNKKHKVIFKTIEIIPIATGVLVSCREKKVRAKRGTREEAKSPREKIPKLAAVNLVSNQPNWPVPKINLTIWALKRKVRREMGIIEKRICLKTEEKFSENFSF